MRKPAIALVLLALAAPAQAQETNCELVRSTGTTVSTDIGTQMQVDRIPRPVFACRGGLEIRADSAMFVHASRQVTLYSNVVYEDTLKSLRAQFAQYTGPTRHLAAQTNVVLIDKKNGSRIDAPYLDVFEEMPGRPQTMIEVYSGRPRTTVVSARDEQAPTTPGAPPPLLSDTTVIDSDGLQIVGDSEFHFRGDVVLTSGTMRATGANADFVDGGGRMTITGAAHVETPEYSLSGDTIIAARDTATNALSDVVAHGRSHLVSEGMDLRSPSAHIFFANGEVERLVAVGNAPADSANRVQAVATSEDFRLTADSIDARAPGQQVEQVIAVGAAHGVRISPDDSTRIRIVAETAQDSALVELLAHDWVRGDTVIAYFRPADSAAASAGDDADARVVERIVAQGGREPARSTYRRVDPAATDRPAEISYLIARQIELLLRDGAIATVNAQGDVKGVYLQPPTRTAAAVPPPDSP